MATEAKDLDDLYGDVEGGVGKGDEKATTTTTTTEADGSKSASAAAAANLEDVYQKYQPQPKQESRQQHEQAPQAPTTTNKAPSSSDPGASVAVYVGNLQWWTTDAEIESACSECG